MTTPPLPFTGLTVLVTGTIDGLSRDEAKAGVATLGGKPVASVTRTLDILIPGEGAGISKLGKARAQNVRIVPADDFAALVADPTSWNGDDPTLAYADWEAAQPTPDDDETPGAPTQAGAPADTAARVVLDMDHLVGRAVLHVPDTTGALTRQVRMLCSCGHAWMRDTLHGPDNTCPKPPTPSPPPWRT